MYRYILFWFYTLSLQVEYAFEKKNIKKIFLKSLK